MASGVTTREILKPLLVADKLTSTAGGDQSGTMIGTMILLMWHPAIYGERPTFEVVSIKPAMSRHVLMGGCSGGPGRNDPVRWKCENIGLPSLVGLQ